jgi:cytochrome c oxidase cbb3-type subunit 3
MNALMIKALAFAAVLIIATIAVVSSLGMDVLADDMTAITMGGAVAVAVLTASISVKYVNQIKNDTASGKLLDDNWDGIGEYQNELPSGWAYTFLGVFLWSMWYGLIGYPVYSYSQIGEYNEEVLAYNKKFEETHKNASPEVLKEMGESIFLVQCSQCHGATGDGLSGRAQDFGSRFSKEQVLDVINNGQNQLGYPMGAMPPGTASGADAEAIAEYVAGGLKGEAPAMYAACMGCHGADSQGNNGMAPNLVKYDAAVMKHVLQHGKKGVIGKMPAFNTLITPVQEKALTAYIQTLAN